MMAEGSGAPWPPHIDDPPETPPSDPPAGHAAITFVGHATFLIRIAGGPTLLTDPIWSDRCSPLPWGFRRARAPGLRLGTLPPLDAVLVSHNHYDHLDRPTLRRLAARQPAGLRIVTGLGNARLLPGSGLASEELDWWQDATLPGATVTYLPMRHASARTPFDRARALWGGFAIRTPAGTILFTGDTAYGPHLREIGDALGPSAIGLIPIGAYEPRWFMSQVHMNPEEALRARDDLRVHTAVAMHFGTFKLTQEGIDAPARDLAAHRAAAGLPPARFIVPRFGETLIIPLGPADAGP
ncbi:MBL fold metallo-hydrolase [Muricoccus radiodurans]|uniref:MBL fold metallo-hydrolase n=1 Tax=Muricoccus radiodurans TaxID=2231721 RepID=UPI003CE90F7D